MWIDLIRHGQVPGNREHRYVGSTDEHLTEEGRRQAEEKKPEPVRMVFSSPRIRCIETAGILYPGCVPVIIPELAECDFGAFEYKNYKELTGDPDYQAWIDSGGTIGFPGGEDMAAFRARSVRGFEEAVRQMKAAGLGEDDRAALVVHGGTVMAVLAELAEPPQDYFQWQCGNAEGFSGRLENGKLYDVRPVV